VGTADLNGTPLLASTASSSTGDSPPVLNDRTVELSPCVYRPWLMDESLFGGGAAAEVNAAVRRGPSSYKERRRHPPFKVLLTNFGWNHPDQGVGLNVTRTIRSRELLVGTVNHPYFDPVDWDEMNRRVVAAKSTSPYDGSEDRTRYYVFMDLETCYE
jgi:hypothetical protein